MKDQISFVYANHLHENPLLNLHLARCIRAALRAEAITVPVEINVLITDDKGIQALNCAYRAMDKPTDVLSFPAFSFTPGAFPADTEAYRDRQTGLVPLGDMAISLQRARLQARTLGHSTAREVGYLAIHSVLHLLGYDHVDEGPMKRQMRQREKEIVKKLGLYR